MALRTCGPPPMSVNNGAAGIKRNGNNSDHQPVRVSWKCATNNTVTVELIKLTDDESTSPSEGDAKDWQYDGQLVATPIRYKAIRYRGEET